MCFRHAAGPVLLCLCHLPEKSSLEELLGLQPGSPNERCGPDLSWLGLQSCVARADLDQPTPSWPADTGAMTAPCYVP